MLSRPPWYLLLWTHKTVSMSTDLFTPWFASPWTLACLWELGCGQGAWLHGCVITTEWWTAVATWSCLLLPLLALIVEPFFSFPYLLLFLPFSVLWVSVPFSDDKVTVDAGRAWNCILLFAFSGEPRLHPFFLPQLMFFKCVPFVARHPGMTVACGPILCFSPSLRATPFLTCLFFVL